MQSYINEATWRQTLSQPTWYLLLQDDFKRLEQLAEQEDDYGKRKAIKRQAYELIEAAVRDGTLPIAASGDNLDAERQPIDTVVIHHTKNKPGMTLERLNAMHLLRIYGSYFANPTDPKEKHFKGEPVWSGHFYKGQQVFWGYHWFVRQDGSAEQILQDNYVGWQAGNWNTNTRSIGICIDDDLSNTSPSKTVIDAIATIIRKHYPTAKIVGHREVNTKTECPGSQFIDGWKQPLKTKTT